jgi:hypothetical protein
MRKLLVALLAFCALCGWAADGYAQQSSTLTLTSATTAYTANQLIASSATAGSVVVPSVTIADPGGTPLVPRLRLVSNDTTSTAWGGKTIQVDLWAAAPTFTNGDRAAWLTATGVANHLAAFTCVMSAVQGDGYYSECAPVTGTYAVLKPGNTTVFWTLQSIDGSGVTGASKTMTLTPEVMQ